MTHAQCPLPVYYSQVKYSVRSAIFKVRLVHKYNSMRCRELRAPLNASVAPSNFRREPKYVLFDLQTTFMKLMKMQLGSMEEIVISSPGYITVLG